MSKIRKNWKVIGIVATVVGAIVAVAMIFWDKIEDVWDGFIGK